MDAVTELIRGSEWQPPEGGVMVDMLLVFMHIDQKGDYGSSWMSAGSLEQAEGMARRVVRSIEISEAIRIQKSYEAPDG